MHFLHTRVICHLNTAQTFLCLYIFFFLSSLFSKSFLKIFFSLLLYLYLSFFFIFIFCTFFGSLSFLFLFLFSSFYPFNVFVAGPIKILVCIMILKCTFPDFLVQKEEKQLRASVGQQQIVKLKTTLEWIALNVHQLLTLFNILN